MPERDNKLIRDLSRAGIPEDVTAQAVAIDGVLQQWRRRVVKRELGRRALSELGLSLDLAQLDVLMAVHAPRAEFGDEAEGETMVTTIACRLDIDRSRASRIVSDLIAMGLVRRDVSQQDARRAIVELTEQGAAIVAAVRSYKFLVLGSFLKGWSREEIETFLPLLERFSAWSDTVVPSDQVGGEIAALRDALRAGAAKGGK